MCLKEWLIMRLLRLLKTVLQTLFCWPEPRNRRALLKAFILMSPSLIFFYFRKEKNSYWFSQSCTHTDLQWDIVLHKICYSFGHAYTYYSSYAASPAFLCNNALHFLYHVIMHWITRYIFLGDFWQVDTAWKVDFNLKWENKKQTNKKNNKKPSIFHLKANKSNSLLLL